MKNLIYKGIITAARNAADGETPTAIYVTEENNGWAIWRIDAESGLVLVDFHQHSRDWALEDAISMTLRERGFEIIPRAQHEGGEA